MLDDELVVVSKLQDGFASRSKTIWEDESVRRHSYLEAAVMLAAKLAWGDFERLSDVEVVGSVGGEDVSRFVTILRRKALDDPETLRPQESSSEA